jgi:hypothetical protein
VAAAPPAPRALPLGGDPERAALAAPRQLERLGIGGTEHLVRDPPRARHGQNNDFAAALAASTSGLG